jgi:hypothetical protein
MAIDRASVRLSTNLPDLSILLDKTNETSHYRWIRDGLLPKSFKILVDLTTCRVGEQKA